MTVANIPSLEQLLQEDLDYICEGLRDELIKLEGKRLLITGGAGFLGYYLVQAPLRWNHAHKRNAPIAVTVWDNYIRGVPDWLTALKSDPNLTIATCDLTEPLPADMGHYDYIIHAAGIGSPMYYRRYPIETMDVNVNGLRSLLDYARAEGEKGRPISGFLYYSTSEIYGDPAPEAIPTPEEYRGNVSCTGPRACYDESKRYGETLCVNFARQFNLPVKMARPFNNYGPGLKITDRRVLPDFARDVFSHRDIVMYSNGAPTRTFCYIADAIVGYYKVLVRGQPGEAYNIGIEKPEISIAQLAQKVIDTASQLFGYRGKLVQQLSGEKDYLVDNPNRRCPIIEKARVQLGYNPSILVDEGIRRAMIWYHWNQEAQEA